MVSGTVRFLLKHQSKTWFIWCFNEISLQFQSKPGFVWCFSEILIKTPEQTWFYSGVLVRFLLKHQLKPEYLEQ